jgi:hypothetical protein
MTSRAIRRKVERLRDAGKQYICEDFPDVREVVLMNPMKG